MSIDPKVLSAKNDVEVKRAKLLHSIKFALGETKRRLAPDLIAEMAWEETKRASGKVADKAVDVAKRKPVLIGGLAAAFGLFLARKPLGKLAVNGVEKLTGEDHAAEGDPDTTGTAASREVRSSDGSTPSVAQFHETNAAIEDKTKRPAKRKAPTQPKLTETTK